MIGLYVKSSHSSGPDKISRPVNSQEDVEKIGKHEEDLGKERIKKDHEADQHTFWRKSRDQLIDGFCGDTVWMAFGFISTSHVTGESADAEILYYLHYYTREMRQYYSRSHGLSSGRSFTQVRWQLSPANTKFRGTCQP